MDGIKCSSLPQMSSWKGFVWLELKRHTLGHSHRRVPCAQAFALVRQVSCLSVPERYSPKKSLKENTSGSGAGTQEIRKKSLKENNSGSGTTFQEKYTSNRRVNSVKEVQKTDTPRLKGRLLQLPDEEKVSSECDTITPAQDGNISKGVKQDDAKDAAKDYCISLLAMAPQPEAKLRAKNE
ncbi:hypothetical protein R1sor_012125 [Riccia sorocarpa]|uniref:Uncharacterized protein n=1 Tax=Riccia sorocarpa TaxID=122646 RepID=A0ABD3I4R9_9MARC